MPHATASSSILHIFLHVLPAMAKTKRARNQERHSGANDDSGLAFPQLEVSSSKLKRSSLRYILPHYIWAVPSFFSNSECEKWIEWMERSPSSYVGHKATRYIASRECFRWQKDSEELALSLFHRLRPLLNNETEFEGAIHCNPNIRLYKYTKGMSFGKHIDESNDVSTSQGSGITRMTILIYLSECKGGATSFDYSDRKGSLAFEPEEGTLLLHLHGDECLVHEGLPVEDGVKYILRTDLVYRVDNT